VRLFTRNGLDWAERYPGIAAAVGKLSCQSCLLDGEVVLCGDDGIPVFNRLRYGRQVKGEALLCAFDLLEVNGRDLRRAPIELRKAVLAKLLRKAPAWLQLIPDCGDTDSSAAPSALSMAPISHWTTVGFCNGCPGGAARSMSQGLRVLVLVNTSKSRATSCSATPASLVTRGS
jgi:hypothetical protein